MEKKKLPPLVAGYSGRRRVEVDGAGNARGRRDGCGGGRSR
jgi:hypothetical protein